MCDNTEIVLRGAVVRLAALVAFVLLTSTVILPTAIAQQQPKAHIQGIVVDAHTKEPLGWTAILLVELNKSAVAHEDGTFQFKDVPPGMYSLKSLRLGYQTTVTPLVVVPGRVVVDITLMMESTLLSTETVVVTGEQRNGIGESIVKPEEVFSGRKLQQQLGRTLAETVNNEPGIAQRTMGPAPARPVIRGLGGDRLLILEDGGRTGDLSATASDHAVVVDPMNAERIEIIRGPAALIYGPNTLGGVINVVRGQIPSSLSDHLHGSLGLQGESVNRGYTGGLSVSFPIETFSFRIDGNGRNADDIRTPIGVLRNTNIGSYSTSAGMSFVQPWGYAGIAGNLHESKYGVPGGFVGAHPDGADIQLRRSHLEGKTEILLASSLFNRLEASGSYSHYYHKELEATGAIGTEFGLLTYNAQVLAYLSRGDVFGNGVVGIWAEYRDFAAGGLIFTPITFERTIAGFLYEELPLDELTLQGSLRFDYRSVTPGKPQQGNRYGEVRSRTFGNFSASFSSIYQASENIFVGTTLTRAFRAPGIEELFSQGPHLAAYSFEVGNPELNEEVGYGVELFTRVFTQDGKAQLAFFRNDINGYIFPRNTGVINPRTLLQTYQYEGRGALMYGGELAAEWKLFSSLVVSGNVSYVHGNLKDTGTPLPAIPPLSGKIGARLTAGDFTFGLTVRGAAHQDRVDEFEEPTDGYLIPDFLAQYHHASGNLFHTLILSVENITNTEYRMHLSRVKSILPEPGRNAKLLYRVYF